ncbi:pentapeptide repeat protein [Calothrix parasitica NIES-267]|uniref:Pentapeptide repeat protein n=1 Tax=Calothrix parasitica NIES-267 TaxID=1973488 RepID=A0A1Z4M0C0_9CYAN|nr:pentapeptide repeat protein [Calothrix parasitica NIES-267]
MSENNQNPREYDAVLGGNSPPPIDGVVLGGIEGLRRRLETGNTQQRVDSLADAVKYGDAGIDLLIEALNDAEIEIRAKAFNILKNIDSEKVQQIVEKGIPLRKGDKLYSVYESIIDYNDYCYDLIDYIDYEDDYYDFEGQLLSQYILKESAKAVALDYHQWQTRQEDFHKTYEIGWDVSDNLRHSFSIITWCKKNKILLRLLNENSSEFEKRLNAVGIENKYQDAVIIEDERYQYLLEEMETDEDNWDILCKLETRVINYLKENHKYELLGQLWFDAVGKLAFVHEESIEKETYFKAQENFDINF